MGSVDGHAIEDRRIEPQLPTRKMIMNKLPMQPVQRKCDGCTECCQGWLHGEAYGKKFFPGQPCHFVKCDGCTIYARRPQEPCVTFKCGWLTDTDAFPEWFKPNLSKVVINKTKTKSGIEYFEVYECGQKIDSSILNYLFSYVFKNQLNLSVQIDRMWNNIGSQEFLQEIEGSQK